MIGQTRKTPLLSWIYYLLAALFLFYEMALQVSPSIMTDRLMHDLQIDAAGLGILTASFSYSYTLMQIPAGMIMDRFSLRLSLTLAIALCAFGTLLFQTQEAFLINATGRFLMGIGSAFAFISVLLVSTRWFAPSLFAFLVGLAQLLAAVGAMSGEAPLAIFIHYQGWQHALALLALFGALLSLVTWCVLRDAPKETTTLPDKEQSNVSHFITLLKKPQTYWIALYAFSNWAPVLIVAGLWGVPYLRVAYHINQLQAAQWISWIWVGLMIASPTIGWLSDKVKKRMPFIRYTALLGTLSSTAFIFLNHTSSTLAIVLLTAMGLASAGQIISFAIIKDITPKEQTGTAVGINNMAVVAGGAFFQPLIGFLLRYQWDHHIVNGIPIYHATHYRHALIVVPICYLIGWCVSFRITETHCLTNEKR